MYWYPLENYTGSLSEGADVSCELLLVVSGSPDMRACRADSESVRKTAFLGFFYDERVSVTFSCARTLAL